MRVQGPALLCRVTQRTLPQLGSRPSTEGSRSGPRRGAASPKHPGKCKSCRAGGGPNSGWRALVFSLPTRRDALWGLLWTPSFLSQPVSPNCSAIPRSVKLLAAFSKLNSFPGPVEFCKGWLKMRRLQSQAERGANPDLQLCDLGQVFLLSGPHRPPLRSGGDYLDLLGKLVGKLVGSEIM